jgi:anti-sigma regulatory factor (Ser/Thr protein kinase)
VVKQMLLDWLSSTDQGPPPTGDALLQLALPPDPPSVGDARRALTDYTRSHAVPDNLAESGVLVISELVTNAVLHAHTPILVLADYDHGTLTLAVQDGEAALPTLLPADTEREGGRGVAIISHLGGTWGIQRTVLGKMVWVSLREP